MSYVTIILRSTTSKLAGLVLLLTVSALGQREEEQEGTIVREAAHLVSAHHLVKLRQECLLYSVTQSSPQVYLVDVREKHDRLCGGMPETEPRVMTLRLDHRHHTAEDDYMTPGKFHTIR